MSPVPSMGYFLFHDFYLCALTYMVVAVMCGDCSGALLLVST